MSYVWIIEGKLAVSPLPSFNDIDLLSEVFDSVVVLIEPHELPLGDIEAYVGEWSSRGVEVYYAPTPDFHPVHLLELFNISRWIKEALRKGGRVLIHCYGGIGRSGMVAAAYLTLSGVDQDAALSHVRQKRPGALETAGQLKVFLDFVALIKRVDEDLFSRQVGFLKRNLDEKTWRHVSKTLQLTLELHEHLNVGIDEEVIYATLYHCLSDDLVREALRKNLVNERILSLMNAANLHSLLIKLAHTLDLHTDSRVVYTESSRGKGVVVVELFCKTTCMDVSNRASDLLELLSKKYGERLKLKEHQYG